MTRDQEIRSEALEQAARVAIAQAREYKRQVRPEEVMRLADVFTKYIDTGEHGTTRGTRGMVH